MKKINILALSVIASAGLAACSNDLIDPKNDPNEQFVQNFLRDFGTPQEGHTFSMAEAATLTVSTDRPTDIRVIAYVNDKPYLFAERYALDGNATLEFDLPYGVQELNVYADNDLYVVKVGNTLNLTRKAFSRDIVNQSETAVTLPAMTTSNSKVLGYSNSHKAEFIGEDWSAQGWKKEDAPWAHFISGWELKDYVTSHNFKTESNTGIFAQYEDVSLALNGTKEYCQLIRMERCGGKDYEFGRIYGNKPSLNESTSFTLVPVYHTGEGRPQPYDYMSMLSLSDDNLHDWGQTFTIDYAATSAHTDKGPNGNTGVISFDTRMKTDESYHRHILRDQNLRAALDVAATVTPLLPDPNDYHDGNNDYDHELPAYEDANPIAFYNAWDEWLNDWLNAPAHSTIKAQVDQLNVIRALLGMNACVTNEHAVPYVTKEGNDKYTIFYLTARHTQFKYDQYDIDHTTNGYDIEDYRVYRFNAYQTICKNVEYTEENTNTVGSQYVYYVRESGTYNIITTITPDRVKKIRRHMPQHVEGGAYPFDGFYYGAAENVYMIDVDGDGDYNDCVFLADGYRGFAVPTYSWILACEDLGNSYDRDYNDIVIGLNSSSTGDDAQSISVTPMAAGGIYPLYLMWNEPERKDGQPKQTYIAGKEIHKWFGLTDYKIHNTDVKSAGNAPGFSFQFDAMLYGNKFSFDDKKNGKIQDGTMNGFWILVDVDDVIAQHEAELVTEEGATGFGIKLNQVDQSLLNSLITDNNIYTVTNDAGEGSAKVAKMIFVGGDWEWPQEQVDIRTAYPKFTEWIGNRGTIWYPIVDEDYKLVTKKP